MGSSTRRTTTPVNVSLSLFRWLNLNDHFDIGNIETSRCNISSDQDAELALLEALHCDFTLVLGDVSVHDLDIRLDLVA